MPPVPNVHTPTASRPGSVSDDLPVYPARADTWLLLPFAQVAPGSSFLEVGTGSGEIALAAVRRGAKVVATDRNPHALRALAARAKGEGLSLGLVRTDLARGLGRFDRVVFNPPYLPTEPAQRDPDRWHNLALDGGPEGTLVTERWMVTLPDHLAVGGEAFVVASTLQPETARSRMWKDWRQRGGHADCVRRRSFEGEDLEVWRLSAPATGKRTG